MEHVHTVLHVDGMTCGKCEAHVREGLLAVPGVSAVEVNREKKTAEVQHDPSTAHEALIAAVVEEGYDAHLQH